MSDLEILKRMRNLSLEAADALWAIRKGKTPDRDILAINQDIHNLRPEVDRVLNQMDKDVVRHQQHN